jgi:putative addiction module component (TIGR02574 family)
MSDCESVLSAATQLSVADRLLIVQKLWDSIPPEAEVPVSREQLEELRRRVAAHDANPESAISREELERRLKKEP